MGKRACCLTVLFLLLCWLPIAIPCRATELFPPSGNSILGETSAVEAGKEQTLPREWLARTPKERDSRLVVPVDAIPGRSFQSEETVLVDVREPAKFAELRIPGSLNLPLFAVKTKTFLKNRSLVLLNEGYSYSELEEECGRLREWGFRASILDGGLLRWIEGGGMVEGNARARGWLDEVPPQVFFRERHYENWVVLDVSEAGDAEMSPLFPEAYRVDLAKEPDTGISRIQAIREQNRHRPFLALLVVSRDGQGHDQLDRLLRKAGVKGAFYLEGGLRAYGEFLNQQAALLEAAGTGRKTISKCPSCP
ncbi:MAG: rhodanese-like domain-containing protein [Syntrophobacteraceae bacterium]